MLVSRAKQVLIGKVTLDYELQLRTVRRPILNFLNLKVLLFLQLILTLSVSVGTQDDVDLIRLALVQFEHCFLTCAINMAII